MEGKYIFAIVILGIFFALVLVSLAFLELKRKSDAKLQAWIEERYSDKNLNKFDYDTVSAEDELPVQNIREERQVDVVAPVQETAAEVEEEIPIADAYGKIEVEGIEEITGNYNENEK